MHLGAHNITTKEYKELYPNAPFMCSKSRSKTSKAVQLSWTAVKRRRQADRMRVQFTDRWKLDPEFRTKQTKRMGRQSRELWQDSCFRERVRRAVSKSSKEKWKDPEYRKKVRGKRKWWKPELACRDLLTELGLWGSEASGVRFYDHKDIPRGGSKGFSFNADFVTKCGLIIHVDGVRYHHDPGHATYEWRKERDAKIDRWCVAHGYNFLRLTDLDIVGGRGRKARPNWCKNMIRRLVQGDIVPLLSSPGGKHANQAPEGTGEG